MDFKNIIVSLRESRNLNQHELAEALSVSRSTVSMWELGSRLPSKEVFEKIADYFDVKIDYLYGREINIEKSNSNSYDEQKRIFANKLNHYMQINDKTQIDLINDLDINKSTISTWCNGLKMPNLSVIKRLADYFQIDRYDLISTDIDKSKYTNFITKHPEYVDLFDLIVKINPEDIETIKILLQKFATS